MICARVKSLQQRGHYPGDATMWTLLLILLVLMALGSVPTWPYSRNWGYAPSGALSVLLVALIVLMFIGTVPFGFDTGPVPTVP
jgi:hypothetical protein